MDGSVHRAEKKTGPLVTVSEKGAGYFTWLRTHLRCSGIYHDDVTTNLLQVKEC